VSETTDEGRAVSTERALLAQAEDLIGEAFSAGVPSSWRAAAERWHAGYRSLLSEADAIVPPLPDGVYARIEMPGRREHTGWVTDETRFGVQAAVVRDWDGRELAAVFPGPACRLIYLPTPLRRPEPQAALTAGDPWADDREDTADLFEDDGASPAFDEAERMGKPL
jgi:hypothetical protein